MKYKIVNSNFSNINGNSYTSSSHENEDSGLAILIYIILFSILFYLIYKLIFVKENFENTCDTKNNNSGAIVAELKNENKELANFKNTIDNKMVELERAKFLTDNYDKIVTEPDDKLTPSIYASFEKSNLPLIDIDKYRVIQDTSDLTNLLSQVSKYKNIYKPGDIVTDPSTETINKNIICYQDKGKLIETTPEFLKNYPECMVCSINESSDLKDSLGWKNTKTNISEVCLYNPNPDPNSPIPTLNDCKKFCKIN